jgi:hypothetical protein
MVYRLFFSVYGSVFCRTEGENELQCNPVINTSQMLQCLLPLSDQRAYPLKTCTYDAIT